MVRLPSLEPISFMDQEFVRGVGTLRKFLLPCDAVSTFEGSSQQLQPRAAFLLPSLGKALIPPPSSPKPSHYPVTAPSVGEVVTLKTPRTGPD